MTPINREKDYKAVWKELEIRNLKRGQNPRHHHRTSRERQSLFRVNHGLIVEIIAEIDLKGYYTNAS